MISRKLVASVLFGFILQSVSGQVADFHLSMKPFYDLANISDSVKRKSETDLQWDLFQRMQIIPFCVEDSVAFMYRGKATSVQWLGDFNGWGAQKDFDNKGKLIPGTDIWIMKCSLPPDARVDYKIVINQTTWIADPENPNQQWTGAGGGSANSELRMPEWSPDPIQKWRPDKFHGSVTNDLIFKSKTLGYSINYSVYLPFEYEEQGEMPVIYVTDGNEYLDPQLGNMVTILDNLIADEKIRPVIAVFVDQREPGNRSNNRRMQELNMSEKYLKFFVNEFIPSVEKKYPIEKDRSTRAILGTSLGGLTSTYFAFSRPDVFSMAGIQSPAYWVHPEIYTLGNTVKNPDTNVSMTAGKINDTSPAARKMKDILESNKITIHYRETNEGHSWGNWKNLIDDILIDFFGF